MNRGALLTLLAASLVVTAPLLAQTYSEETVQRVESRKGYVVRLPGEASLDSTRSGWNPGEMFERRVYTIDGAGEFEITVTIASQDVPERAREEGAYTFLDHDSVSSYGTIRSRTYYLPTRRVEIRMIPYGAGWARYAEQRDRILASFRWKAGASSNSVDVPEGTPIPDVPSTEGMLPGN